MSDYDIGIKQVQLTGRKTQYQRVGVNQTIASANGTLSIVVDVPFGTKSLNIVYSCVGNAQMSIYGCDVNGNSLISGGGVVILNNSGTAKNGTAVIADWGGNPKVNVIIIDKTASAGNILQFVDIWSTMA